VYLVRMQRGERGCFALWRDRVQSGPESGAGVGGAVESGLLTVARDTALFQLPLVILLRLRNQTQNKKAVFLIKGLLIGI